MDNQGFDISLKNPNNFQVIFLISKKKIRWNMINTKFYDYSSL